PRQFPAFFFQSGLLKFAKNWTTAAKSPFAANSSRPWMRWKRCCKRRKPAALPLGWVVALAGLGGAACALFSVPTRGGSVTAVEPGHAIVGPVSDVGGEATR